MSIAQPGDNSRHIDDREILLKHHVGRIDEILDRKAEVNEELKQARKKAKADGFELGDEVDFALKIRRAESSATVAAGLRRRLQAAAFMGLPINFQPDLFAARSDDAEDRAYEAGLDAGIEGRNATPPEQFSAGPLSARWMEGWHTGQDRLKAAMQKRMEAANAAAASATPKPRGRPAGSKNKPKEAAPAELKTEADLRPRHKRQPGAAAEPDPDNQSGTGSSPFEPATKY